MDRRGLQLMVCAAIITVGYLCGCRKALPAVGPLGAQDQSKESASNLELASMWRRVEIAIDVAALDSAIATGDPAKWHPLMGELRHFNVPREKGIAVLRTYLSHLNPAVRLAAAQYLFELGSREGGPILVKVIENPATKDVEQLQLAASLLYQYRYPIGSDAFFAAYQRTGNSSLLKYAQLMGSPLALPETKQRLLAYGPLDGAMHMAGIMRLNDPDSIAAYTKQLQSESAARREMANAALYRATREPRYLEYVIAVAEAAVGLRPRDGLVDHTNSGSEAFTLLQSVVVPETTASLKQLEQAARKNRHEAEAGRALAGLFYIHRAYDYVDALVMAQFTGQLPEGLRIAMIWELATARRTPGMEAAAKAYNRDAYEREFLRKAGRPAESWIYQYLSPDIPAELLPAPYR